MPGGAANQDEAAKRRASGVSLAFNVVQSLLKIGAALVTGSVSVLSEAIHSTTDVVASLMAFVGVRAAAAPPDEEHPYGHGKIESLAGFGESILLFCIVIYIFIESIDRLLNQHHVLESLDLGIVVMTIGAVGCLIVAQYVRATAAKTKSLALKSNGRHLLADFVTSLGVLAALGGTKLTGWPWLDPVIAMVLAVWMCWGAWTLAHEAFQNLIDRRLEDEDVQRIEEIVSGHPEVIGHHRLRTRLSGNVRYIDMHIVVPSHLTLVKAHGIADSLEKEIANALSPAQVVIHVDPYDEVKALHPETNRRTDPLAPQSDTER